MNIKTKLFLGLALVLLTACQKPASPQERAALQANAKNHGTVLGMAESCKLTSEAREYDGLYRHYLMEKFGGRGIVSYTETARIYTSYADAVRKQSHDCALAKRTIDTMTDVLRKEIKNADAAPKP